MDVGGDHFFNHWQVGSNWSQDDVAFKHKSPNYMVYILANLEVACLFKDLACV